MMNVRQLASGAYEVPARAESDGVIGDGTLVVEPGTDEWQRWDDFLKRAKRFNPRQPRDPHTGEWIDVPGSGLDVPQTTVGGSGGAAVDTPAPTHLDPLPDLGHERNGRIDGVLGKGVVDTLEKHTTADGTYTRARSQTHRRAITKRLAGHRTNRERPEVLFTAGGPASGKSSTLERPEVRIPEDAAHLDQDLDKAELPEYRALSGIDSGRPPDAYASDAVAREAADINSVEYRTALHRRMNVISEGTGDSGPGQFANRIRRAKAAGYRTSVVYASAPTDIATERAIARAKKIGRAVPLPGLEAMHANVSRVFPEIEALLEEGTLDNIELWDTRAKSPVRMAHSVGRKLVIDDQTLFDEFLAKQHENDGSLIQAPGFL